MRKPPNLAGNPLFLNRPQDDFYSLVRGEKTTKKKYSGQVGALHLRKKKSLMGLWIFGILGTKVYELLKENPWQNFEVWEFHTFRLAWFLKRFPAKFWGFRKILDFHTFPYAWFLKGFSAKFGGFRKIEIFTLIVWLDF